MLGIARVLACLACSGCAYSIHENAEDETGAVKTLATILLALNQKVSEVRSPFSSISRPAPVQMAVIYDRKKVGEGKLDVEDQETYNSLYPDRDLLYSGPDIEVPFRDVELSQFKKLVRDDPIGRDLTAVSVYTRPRVYPENASDRRPIVDFKPLVSFVGDPQTDEEFDEAEVTVSYVAVPAKIVIRDDRGVWCDIGAKYLAWMPMQEIIDEEWIEFFSWNRYVRLGDVFAAEVRTADEFTGDLILAPLQGTVPAEMKETLRQMRETDEHKLQYWPYSKAEHMDLTGIFPLSNITRLGEYMITQSQLGGGLEEILIREMIKLNRSEPTRTEFAAIEDVLAQVLEGNYPKDGFKDLFEGMRQKEEEQPEAQEEEEDAFAF
jgi:hypothetical protein